MCLASNVFIMHMGWVSNVTHKSCLCFSNVHLLLVFTNWNTINFQRCEIIHVSILCYFFQRYPAAAVQLQGDGDPAGHSGGGLGRSPGRCANLRHLPQDQVRRRLREPVLVLPDQVLCPLWGASVPAIQHGESWVGGGGSLCVNVIRQHFLPLIQTYPVKTTNNYNISTQSDGYMTVIILQNEIFFK